MTTPLARPATRDGLFLWVMHRFAEAFEEHAVLKGGIALALLDCPRSTTDIDYVFVPFESKKDVRHRIGQVLAEIEGGTVSISTHSKMVRASLEVDAAAILIEANVATACPSTPIATARFATERGQPSRIVRIMALDCALAHKLAAWNERRLLRDLYDCYFLSVRLGEKPALNVLDERLARIESRLPRLEKRRSMTRADLAAELRGAAHATRLSEDALRAELGPILPPDEMIGLVPRLRSAVVALAEYLERDGAGQGDAKS